MRRKNRPDRAVAIAETIASLSSRGMDHVAIVGKPTPEVCSAFLHKVFSISGRSKKYPPLAVLGKFPIHDGCEQSLTAFVDDLADEVCLRAATCDSFTLSLASLIREGKWDEAQRHFDGTGGARIAKQWDDAIVESIRQRARSAGYEPPRMR
jgi:hypothetical protein